MLSSGWRCLKGLFLAQDLKQVDDYIFPGGKIGKPLSNAGMSSVLKRMKVTDAHCPRF